MSRLETTRGVQRVLSGLPVTRELAVLPSNHDPVQYLGRMSDGRTATFTQTDISVSHKFKVAGTRQIQLSFTADRRTPGGLPYRFSRFP